MDLRNCNLAFIQELAIVMGRALLRGFTVVHIPICATAPSIRLPQTESSSNQSISANNIVGLYVPVWSGFSNNLHVNSIRDIGTQT